jgi:transposase
VEQMRKRYPPSFRGKVALEAIREQKTSAELATLFQVHPGQIRNWKGIVLKGLVDLFSDRRKGEEQDNEKLIAELYRQIGQLKVDLNWLKEKSGLCPIGIRFRSLTIRIERFPSGGGSGYLPIQRLL